MSIPRFTADAALDNNGRQYVIAGRCAASSNSAALPQLMVARGWTREECEKACDDKVCRFDDIGDICGACYAICERLPRANIYL
jgi:hypothetical protein